MKKLLLTSALSLVFCFVFAQNSLLWKISGNGLEEPSYLFGTIHLICPDDFFLPENVKTSLNSCDKLVLEVDMSDPTLMQKMQAGMLNINMKNIKTDLEEADIKLLNETLTKSMGVGVDQLGILKPWALSTMISVKLCLECQQPAQYEAEIMKMAKEKELPLVGLETVEDQLGIFDNIPYDRQLELLMEGVKDLEKNKELFANIVKFYTAQDVEGLYEMMLEQDEMKDFGEFLLDARNERWIPVMDKLMSNEPCFIAVGAGHLGGDKGVIKLLKEKGYQVEAVK